MTQALSLVSIWIFGDDSNSPYIRYIQHSIPLSKFILEKGGGGAKYTVRIFVGKKYGWENIYKYWKKKGVTKSLNKY